MDGGARPPRHSGTLPSVTVREFPRHEVEEAFATFRRLGAERRDWPAWAALFTDDAHYVEHHLGTFDGNAQIHDWIVSTMEGLPSMTFSIDWWIIEANRVVFSIWNHLPDPAGGGERYSFPNLSAIEYAGGGRWSREEDWYNPADADRVVGAWLRAGGTPETPPDPSLTGLPGWAPDPGSPACSRQEVLAEIARYRERSERAVATGDWDQWAGQFTDDARYLEHHYGRFHGQREIRAWITSVMQPFPEMVFPVEWVAVDGNRVVMLCWNRLPDPAGRDVNHEFGVGVILHYAGGGKWSYEEDVYNPQEAEAAIASWVAAGGTLPGG